MLKMLAACAAGVTCLAGCASSIALPASSPGGIPPSDSPAASLRVRMTLLMGEHTYVLAKLTVAAAAGRKDEYRSYAGLLATVGDDVTTTFTQAVGATQGGQIGQAWVAGDGYFVDYIVAATTHQQDMAGTALANLSSKFVPPAAQALSAPLNIATSTATRMLTDEIMVTRQLIDDAAAGTPSAFYPDVRAAYVMTTAMGGALAEATAWKFPDKYPGNATGAGARLRAQLDGLLQEHAYLLSMTTDAASGGATADGAAAVVALETNTRDLTDALASIFGSAAGAEGGRLWSAEDASFVAYASATDGAARSAALSDLDQSSTPGLSSFLAGLHVTADVASVTQQTIGLIDDQRAKSYAVVAAEDRQSAALLVSIGDLMMGAPS